MFILYSFNCYNILLFEFYYLCRCCYQQLVRSSTIMPFFNIKLPGIFMLIRNIQVTQPVIRIVQDAIGKHLL